MQESIAATNRNASVRKKVLDAAVRLFTDVGYFRTSMPDIVRESGVSTGSIYHHFGDKEGVARALYDALTARMEREIAAIEAQHEKTEDQCRAIIELLFRLTEEEPHVMEFMIHAKHKEFLPELAPICSSRPMVRLRELVTIGIEKGEIRKVAPLVAAATIYGATFRIIQLYLDGLIESPISRFLDEVWDCSWRSIAPDS